MLGAGYVDKVASSFPRLYLPIVATIDPVSAR